ncbi:MAG TPA: MarR family winged helix-turn-helix transcriptional regulator [Candidatus Limnocylindria bacterium]|nr:MarR family winged helix-turn-helix transcriptional regulator [Candidatus Limnocylindria bacterium]
MAEPAAKRLSILYQLYLTNQAARRFMRLALARTEMTGEEYALYSYLFGNGPRTLTQASRDLGLPITTLATLLGPLIESGEFERRPHPTDRRARLLDLTDSGRQRLEAAIPDFTVAYRALLGQMEEAGVEDESIFTALDELRTAIGRTSDLLEAEHAEREP